MPDILLTYDPDQDRARVLSLVSSIPNPTWVKLYQNPLGYQTIRHYSGDTVTGWISLAYETRCDNPRCDHKLGKCDRRRYEVKYTRKAAGV